MATDFTLLRSVDILINALGTHYWFRKPFKRVRGLVSTDFPVCFRMSVIAEVQAQRIHQSEFLDRNHLFIDHQAEVVPTTLYRFLFKRLRETTTRWNIYALEKIEPTIQSVHCTLIETRVVGYGIFWLDAG
jgi:hypothetical protein